MISNLITDRTQTDVSHLRAQREKILNEGWAALSEAEQMEYLAGLKGGYNTTDLNRVTHAMEYLVERIRSYGYTVKYEKVKVPHQPQRGKSRLPAGYTELEYIESTGTQYIDTGFAPNQDTRVVMDFEIEDGTTTSNIFGGRTSYKTNDFTFWLNNETSWLTNYNGTSTQMAVSTVNGRHTVDKNKNVTSIDGIKDTATYGSFQAPCNMFLFTMNQNGTAETRMVSMKLYSCQIYDNDTLIRDFVPCTDASGTIGLYDMVNSVFYENAGTGVFTAGSEVELPPVEILDDYTWYHSDIPQAKELGMYLQNARKLRNTLALFSNTPYVPDDMERFTFEEANNIETILVNIEAVINLMIQSWIYGGEIFSGEVI